MDTSAQELTGTGLTAVQKEKLVLIQLFWKRQFKNAILRSELVKSSYEHIMVIVEMMESLNSTDISFSQAQSSILEPRFMTGDNGDDACVKLKKM